MVRLSGRDPRLEPRPRRTAMDWMAPGPMEQRESSPTFAWMPRPSEMVRGRKASIVSMPGTSECGWLKL